MSLRPQVEARTAPSSSQQSLPALLFAHCQAALTGVNPGNPGKSVREKYRRWSQTCPNTVNLLFKFADGSGGEPAHVLLTSVIEVKPTEHAQSYAYAGAGMRFYQTTSCTKMFTTKENTYVPVLVDGVYEVHESWLIMPPTESLISIIVRNEDWHKYKRVV